jgi:YHS domain-containing protein
MEIRGIVFTAAVALLVTVNGAAAQNEGPQGSPGASSQGTAAQVAQCSQVQANVNAAIDMVVKRLEEARQTNSAAAMRAATDDVQAALLQVRSQLSPCGQMQAPASADVHAGHLTPGAPGPAAAAQAPATSVEALRCSTAVDAKPPVWMFYQGRIYYFCSEQARAAFAKDPKRVIGAPAAPGAPAHEH